MSPMPCAALRRLIGGLVAAVVLSLAAAAEARPAQCDTLIDGEPVTIYYDSSDPAFASFRDRLFTRGRSCPAAIVITYLLPDLTAAEREVFCANYDARTGSHSLPAQGRRDAYGRCVEPSRTCQLVNTSRETAMELMGIGAEVEEGGERPSGIASAVSAATHWSGAMVLSGNAGSISGLLSAAGTTAGTVLGSPALLAGAAASVVVVGGAVWLCSDSE